MSTTPLITENASIFHAGVFNANEYRYNQVREWQSELKKVIDVYTLKVKKYRRRITVLDVLVYSVSAVVASTGVVLSAITPVTAVVTATICVSTSTTIAGVFGIIAKKISSCANTKLHNYTTALNAATDAYKKLSSLISSSLDARSSSSGAISDSEFELMSDTYNDFLNLNSRSSDSRSSDLKTKQINNNINDVNGTTSTNSHKHNPGENHNDISILD